MHPRAPKVALAALCAALAPPASAPTAQRCPSGEIDAVSEWGAARVGADIAEVLRSEQMDGGALALASVAELRSLGLPLGAALKLKACFATGGSTTASGWRTLAVTASHPLTVAKDTVLPATTSVEVSDGGTINVASGVTLAINGTFSAPPQHVFVGPGRVLLSGDESGRNGGVRRPTGTRTRPARYRARCLPRGALAPAWNRQAWAAGPPCCRRPSSSPLAPTVYRRRSCCQTTPPCKGRGRTPRSCWPPRSSRPARCSRRRPAA